MQNECAIRRMYQRITKELIRRGLTITTMESCTAGLIASLLTDTEGASAALKGAFVTYSNEAKMMQGVPEETIKSHGVYSEETAAEMALSCRNAYRADIGIGVTGTFGNADPENADSISGEIFFAIAVGGEMLRISDAEGDAAPSVRTSSASVPPQPSRYAYKLRAAEVVGEALLALLTGGADSAKMDAGTSGQKSGIHPSDGEV